MGRTIRPCIFPLAAGLLALGCASAPVPEAISTTQLTSASVPASHAEPKNAPAANAVPKTTRTPRRQLKAKSAEDLARALPLVHKASSVEGAAQRLTDALGKPTWSSTVMGMSEVRRVWIAPAGDRCQRLILEPDGSASLDSARWDDWRPVASTANQNPCTGEVRSIKLRKR